MKLAIIDYGAGNIKSVQFAFKRLGIEAKLTCDYETIMSADKIIFPGVGQASSAMKMLKKNHLNKLIPNLKQPVLGICLGMQLMCNHTEEGNTQGLEIFDVNIKKFSNQLKVPQMGWNTVYNLNSSLFKHINDDSYMYSVHSYYAELGPNTIATSDYGLKYASALEFNNFYGVQFHPEKSSNCGSQLLKNFIEL